MKRMVVFVLLVFALVSGCSMNNNECDQLVKFVCKDKRFEQVKTIWTSQKKSRHFIEDTAFNDLSQDVDIFKGIDDDCGRAKELARLSHEAATPLARGLALDSCKIYNQSISFISQLVPDR